MENNSTYMTVTNGNVNADEIASLQAQVTDLTRQLSEVKAAFDRTHERLQSAQAVRDEQARDWAKLNEFLNKYADEKAMCSEYEKQLDEWNQSFESLELEGRVREYEVEVECSFRYTFTKTVEASSEAEARRMVEDMSPSEAMESADWDYPEDEEMEVGDVSLA